MVTRSLRLRIVVLTSVPRPFGMNWDVFGELTDAARAEVLSTVSDPAFHAWLTSNMIPCGYNVLPTGPIVGTIVPGSGEHGDRVQVDVRVSGTGVMRTSAVPDVDTFFAKTTPYHCATSYMSSTETPTGECTAQRAERGEETAEGRSCLPCCPLLQCRFTRPLPPDPPPTRVHVSGRCAGTTLRLLPTLLDMTLTA